MRVELTKEYDVQGREKGKLLRFTTESDTHDAALEWLKAAGFKIADSDKLLHYITIRP